MSLATRELDEQDYYPGSAQQTVAQFYAVCLSRALQCRKQQVDRAFGRAVEWFRYVELGGPKS